MKQFKRVVLYIRVSTEEQALYGDSLRTQEDDLVKFANEHGYVIVKIYRDEGFSARKSVLKRKVMQELLKDAREGLFDLILFTKMDRWFRSIKEYYKVQEVLEECKIDWKTTLEDYDTSTSDGRFKINIMLSVAENEADRTSERIKFVLNGKLENKEPVTGAQPWGYKIFTKEGRKYIDKDPEIAPMVDDMFEHYETHNNVAELTRYMNSKYSLETQSQTWSRRLKNKAYTGEHKGVKDYRPAYISKERHDKILDIMKTRGVRRPPTGRVYLYSGLLICPDCGGKMSGCVKTPYGRSKQTYINYRCTKAWTGGKCNHRSIIQENTINDYLLRNVDKELEKYILSVELEQAKAKNNPKRDARKYEDQLKRLNNMYMIGNIEDDEYITKSKELKALISKIKAETTETTKDLTSLKNFLKSDFRSLYDSLDRTGKRALWRSIIKEIHIYQRMVDYVIFSD